MVSARVQLPIYTVVEVWRGIAVGAKNFRRRTSAIKHLRRLRQSHDMQDDDVQLFETTVQLTPEPRSDTT